MELWVFLSYMLRKNVIMRNVQTGGLTEIFRILHEVLIFSIEVLLLRLLVIS